MVFKLLFERYAQHQVWCSWKGKQPAITNDFKPPSVKLPQKLPFLFFNIAQKCKKQTQVFVSFFRIFITIDRQTLSFVDIYF